ncbi:MAG: AAA family ATPase [Salinarimonas sp.]|nr:AAA family ATPase [Salinarimonas sp.]
MRPVLWLIAGPEGAGKTTYAFRHIRAVSGATEFVNLDEIARGLSPLDVEAGRLPASRVAIERIRDLFQAHRTFSLETTLAGRTHLRTIASAKRAGFDVVILYFAVDRVETCLARIARRVSEGGHDIPENEARRRFIRSLDNVPGYFARADLWRVFDANRRPVIVAEGRGDCLASLGSGDADAPQGIGAEARDGLLGGLPAALAVHLRSLPPCSEAGEG